MKILNHFITLSLINGIEMGASSSHFVEYDADKYLNEISPSLVIQEIYKNRFLKTIKCISEEGMVIVKIFIKQSSSKLPDYLKKSIAGM